MWTCLRSDFGVKFRRQEPVDRYVVDFLCYARRLIVEVDGVRHADSCADRDRDARLRDLGFEVIRFWNGEVIHELSMVLDTIGEALRRLPSVHSPRRRKRSRG